MAGEEKIPGGRVVAKGHHAELTVDEIADLLPGGAALMDALGRRYWVMYYAAKGGNWDLARYEWRESLKVLRAMAKARPKYAEDLAAFEKETFAPIGKALDAGDFPAFERAYRDGIEASDTYHRKYEKPYIRFRLPDRPPEWLDVSERE
ncbi:MAG TPA: hypothetical protein VI915_03315 [Thermoplasmata archaeon]|nr:hypothetical protein [Thermoplasmata archaeon]